MRPEDLIELTRSSYANPDLVEEWSAPPLVDEGLNSDEVHLLERMPVRAGRLLLLGIGGGREAVAFAQMGFEVTGVDFVPEMVAHAKANARRHHVEIEGLVQDISDLELAQASFEVVWFSTDGYSFIPTRRLRISMLQRLHHALQPGGCVVCQFSWNPYGATYSPRRQRLGSLVAILIGGNREFEDGDRLFGGLEFIHSFQSEPELCSEFESAGFSLHYLSVGEETCMDGAILVKGPM